MAQFRADDLGKIELFALAFCVVIEVLYHTFLVLLLFDLGTCGIANVEFLAHALFTQFANFSPQLLDKAINLQYNENDTGNDTGIVTQCQATILQEPHFSI